MAYIPLTGGKFALVDDEDFQRLSVHRWLTDKTGYAFRFDRSGASARKIFMHRDVLGLTDPAVLTDHANGNKADNRKANLRECTKGQNNVNKGRQRNNTMGFKGVCWSPRLRKWYSYIRVPGARRFLGTYATPHEAHEVYCLAADLIHGEFANHGGSR
ncbi:MAG: HNH endonuclease [Burkholderia sp.]